jgi:hypothetical protein
VHMNSVVVKIVAAEMYNIILYCSSYGLQCMQSIRYVIYVYYRCCVFVASCTSFAALIALLHIYQ